MHKKQDLFCFLPKSFAVFAVFLAKVRIHSLGVTNCLVLQGNIAWQPDLNFLLNGKIKRGTFAFFTFKPNSSTQHFHISL